MTLEVCDIGLLCDRDTAVVEILSLDADGDGVVDADDACPGTTSDALVDASGCAIAQYCPCEGPAGLDRGWKNTGQYNRCVARTAERFVAAGLLTEEDKLRIVEAAAMSDCGTKR